MEGVSSEEGERFAERVQHHQSQVEQLLRQHGREFSEFVAGHEPLVAVGDQLLQSYQTTGYNILLHAEDMPLTSQEALIFYSNYLGRPRHFGLLLAEMERVGIMTTDQVRFGVRAS